jgi:hypothetical protein
MQGVADRENPLERRRTGEAGFLKQIPPRGESLDRAIDWDAVLLAAPLPCRPEIRLEFGGFEAGGADHFAHRPDVAGRM